jgi:hypothetical protein
MKHSEKAIKSIYGSKGSNRTEPVFALKISEGEKYANDKQWFKDYTEYVVPAYSSTVDGAREMKLAYDVYNDNIDGFKDELKKFVNPLNINIGQIEKPVVAYPILHNKVNVLKGENLKRKDDLKVILLASKLIREKDEKLLQALKRSVEEDVLLQIEKTQMEMQGMSEQEVGKYVEEMRSQATPEDILNKKFSSEFEIFMNKALKYAQFDQQIALKKDETFQDTIVVDRCFIYSGWNNGKPYLEVRNPLYSGFHKAPNEMFVNKGDYFWYKKPITIADVYNNYGDYLSEDDIETLGVNTHTNNYRIDKRHGLGKDNRPVFDHTAQEVFRSLDGNELDTFDNKNIGTHQGQGIDKKHYKESLVWETHIEFKAYRKVIFITYYDEYNNEIVIPVPESFDIPKSAKEIEFTNKWGNKSKKHEWLSGDTFYIAEEIWIPRKYEVIRLGENIYPICREVPYQYTDIEHPYSSFSLSTFGAIFTSRNSKSISLFQRAIPSYFQFLYIKHVQNEELSKYQGFINSIDVDQIPKQLGMDVDGNTLRDPIATWMLYRKQYGTDFYSGSQTSAGGLPPATRSPGSTGYVLGTANEIYLLQQLAEVIKAEIGLAMGISPQRESLFSSNSNVSDNQQAIAQSHHITEPYFFYHNEVWKLAIEDYLNNFRTYCKKISERSGENPMFHFILPDGTEELLEVIPSMLKNHAFGLYATNSSDNQMYLDSMFQHSFAIAQNAGEGMEEVSTIIKAISSGASSEETHKMIQMVAQKQRERAQEMEQMKLKVQEEYIAREKENREDIQAHEIEKEHIKGSYDLQKATINASGLGADVNNNQIPDTLEVFKATQKADADMNKLELESKKLGLEQEKLAQKTKNDAEKLKIDRKKASQSNSSKNNKK